MTKNKFIIVFVLLLIGFSYGVYQYSSSFKEDDNRFSDMKSYQGASTNAAASELGEADTLSQPNIAARSRQNEAVDSIFQEESMKGAPDETEVSSFLESEAFSSSDMLDATFIRSDGAVERSALSQSFQQENFSDFVYSVENAGADRISSEREFLLSNQLLDTFGSQAYQSHHSCSGSICAVTFKSIDAVTDDALSELATFDKNYTFTNRTTNDLGESIIKAIYIATDDPSQLRISQ